MSRLDPRIETNLAAKALYPSTLAEQHKTVQIRNLSLGGALLEGLALQAKFITVQPELPDAGQLILKGEIVRVENGCIGVKLLFTDATTLPGLWEFIRGRLTRCDHCLYCGQGSARAQGTCQHCGRAMDFTAEDYLQNHLLITARQRLLDHLESLDSQRLQTIIQVIDREILKSQGNAPDEEFVGTSANMLAVFDMIRKVAPTDMNVLILGESGTGKELTAKAIHQRSQRRDKPFMTVNAAAIPEGLLEAELFGFEKGAFTGAHMARKGKFELADGGTLFLDEIGDLPSTLQAKLLRFLEDRVVERIGAKGGTRVNVRIVAATNAPLEQTTASGDFRSDLYFRLSAFTIRLPPLRERGADRSILAKYFLKKITAAESLPVSGFSADALAAIQNHDWPGNVRELINRIRRGVIMASGDRLCPADMELEYVPQQMERPGLKSQVSQTKQEIVLKALEDNHFVVARAARALGISRTSLYGLMRKYSLR